MTTATNHTPTTDSESPYVVHLRKGLPADRGGQKIFYKKVVLRETALADERIAVRLAERVVHLDGQPRLLVSDADYKLALNMRHIARFVCDSLTIEGDELDLDVIGKLHPLDWARIENKVFLVELAQQLDFGEITQAQYDLVVGGKAPQTEAPQPQGPTADAGALGATPESGPTVLAVYAGGGAPGAPSILDGTAGG